MKPIYVSVGREQCWFDRDCACKIILGGRERRILYYTKKGSWIEQKRESEPLCIKIKEKRAFELCLLYSVPVQDLRDIGVHRMYKKLKKFYTKGNEV